MSFIFELLANVGIGYHDRGRARIHGVENTD